MHFFRKYFLPTPPREVFKPAEPIVTYREPESLPIAEVELPVSGFGGLSPRTDKMLAKAKDQLLDPSHKDRLQVMQSQGTTNTRDRYYNIDENQIVETSRDVGHITAEITTMDDVPVVYSKVFAGVAPDPSYYLNDKRYPGLLVIPRPDTGSASYTSLFFLRMPLQKLKYANSMYDEWVKASHERGYFRVEVNTGDKDVNLGPEGVTMEIDIPVSKVKFITLRKKSNVVSWKEVTVLE